MAAERSHGSKHEAQGRPQAHVASQLDDPLARALTQRKRLSASVSVNTQGGGFTEKLFLSQFS